MRVTAMRGCSLLVALALAAVAVAPPPITAGAKPRDADIGSDFNGDGYADLAINIGDSGGIAGDGVDAVVVVYGSPRGLTAGRRQRLEATDFDPKTKDLNLGAPLATGDFDGDGYADLVIANSDADVGKRANAGAVRIVYGSARGLDVRRTQRWTQSSPGIPDRAEDGDNFGWAAATGEFGNGEQDDLAVTTLGEDGRYREAGAVTVLYGSQRGLTSAGSQDWTSATPGVPGVGEEFEQFGDALAAGRFSASGYDDLAIGIPSATVAGRHTSGAVVVLRGSAAGLTDVRSARWTQNSPGVVGRSQNDDSFGDALVTGQFGRGPQEDLAIGTPGETLTGRPNAGAVTILYGTAEGLSATGNQMRSQRSPGIAGIAESDDFFGSLLATANVLGGDHDDLIVAAPNEWIRGDSRTGQVHILRGDRTGLSTTKNLVIPQATQGPQDSATRYELSGSILAAADFDGSFSVRDGLVIGQESDTGKGGTNSALQVFASGTQRPLYWTPATLGEVARDRIFAGATAS